MGVEDNPPSPQELLSCLYLQSIQCQDEHAKAQHKGSGIQLQTDSSPFSELCKTELTPTFRQFPTCQREI